MLSQPVAYAASALSYLAGAGDRCVLVREVSRATGIPSPYLAKLVNALSRKGMVITQRGVGGGICLARDPDEITLYDVCAALDDPCIGNRCLFGSEECSCERPCPAHAFWRPRRDELIAYLQRTTVREVAAYRMSHRCEEVAPASPRRPEWWSEAGRDS